MMPLVSCLCLTRNRREWLPKAIECFERQTYENKELVIVADSMADVHGFVHPYDLVVFHPGVVGAKRNVGCSAARGEIVAVWDDDDYSAPGRLAGQVARLQESGKAVTGYRDIKFTDGSKWWQYSGDSFFAAGTSLCFRREWWLAHKFQEINCGQDEAFAAFAASRKQLAGEVDLNLMYATVHPGNTSPRPVFGSLAGTAWSRLRDFQWRDGGAACAV